MENNIDNQIINLANSNSVLMDIDVYKIAENINKDVTIVYFCINFSKEDKILNLLEKGLIKQIIIVSSNYQKVEDKRISITTNINANIIKKSTQNIIVIASLNNVYANSKLLINNLEKLFILSNKYDKKLGFNISKNKIIALIFSNNSIYTSDIINALKVLTLPSKKEKYEFIYDTICNYLDNEFHKCNICDFKNNQCIANRENRYCGHTTMGCCYSFDYAGAFDPRFVKNVKLCKYMKDKLCSTKNISCKLFTCKYLKEKNISFNTHKILLLDCFFNKKQHEIITSNFFRKREEILEKLLEKNYDTYLWYYIFKKYEIKN